MTYYPYLVWISLKYHVYRVCCNLLPKSLRQCNVSVKQWCMFYFLWNYNILFVLWHKSGNTDCYYTCTNTFYTTCSCKIDLLMHVHVSILISERSPKPNSNRLFWKDFTSVGMLHIYQINHSNDWYYY